MSVRVNLNAVAPDGTIRVSRRHFTHLPGVGDSVAIYEPEGELAGMARVVAVNAANDQVGVVYLDVDWDSMQDAPLSSHMEPPPSPATARAVERIADAAGLPRALQATYDGVEDALTSGST